MRQAKEVKCLGNPSCEEVLGSNENKVLQMGHMKELLDVNKHTYTYVNMYIKTYIRVFIIMDL